MIELTTRGGARVSVPESPDEDPSPRFGMGQLHEAAEYYAENGYAILREIIDPLDCDEVRGLWDRHVKPSNRIMCRQAGEKFARHALNEQGWVMNPPLNPHSVKPREFRPFRDGMVHRIFNTPNFAKTLGHLLQGNPKIVQSMYFEGNSATQEHQDSFYLDSENVGEMVAAWIALEDIAPNAGRFFVSPASHQIDRCSVPGKSYDERHNIFIANIKRELHALPIRAPALQKGDVLFWHPLTIHGSLDSQNEKHTRSSITCHAIRQEHRLFALRERFLCLDGKRFDHVLIHFPMDEANPSRFQLKRFARLTKQIFN